MYIVSLEYKVELEKVDQFLAEHKLYLVQQYENGNFLFSGRKEPRTGGVIAVRDMSANDLQNILEQDPFFKADLIDYSITKMSPSMAQDTLKSLVEQ